jgi:Ca-activated chloride channel homolog
MWPVVKLAGILCVVSAMGALQYAMPSFTQSQQSVNGSAAAIEQQPAVITLPANTGSWRVADPYLAKRGSLYFSPSDAEQSPVYQASLGLKTQVEIHVTGMVARTQVRQTFKNDQDEWQNALYVFPLPENAAVDHMQMQVGERVIEGQIKEKQQAKKIFVAAKQAGKKASLVEQQRPNMFSNHIANIAPGEQITVTIEYQQTLDYQQGQYSLRFPMTITPRYVPSNNQQDAGGDGMTDPLVGELASTIAQVIDVPTNVHQGEDSNKSAADQQNTEDLDLQVYLHAGVALEQIDSAYHQIVSQEESPGHYHIALAQQTMANRDFVLSWQPKLSQTVQVSHFQQQFNQQTYGLIMIYPPQDLSNSPALTQDRDVIFVLDTSGSMTGESILQAKQALLLALDELSVHDTFNVIEFNSTAQRLWPTSQAAESERLQEARDFIENLSANGGTEMAGALSLALEQSAHQDQNDRLKQVIFMTDGSVGNENALMQLIQQKLGEARLFTVGIGSAPNSYFMSEAAQSGKGTYTYIGAVSEVKDKMLSLLQKLAHPAVTDLHLRLNGQRLDLQGQLESYPRTMSDLYLGEPLVLSYQQTLSAQSKQPAVSAESLSLHGRFQKASWQQPLTASTIQKQAGLNVLWARQKITQLSRDLRTIGMDNRDVERGKVIQQHITDTALSHHLVSQFTSLVAVDITPSKPANLVSVDTQVKNRAPLNNPLLGQLPQTATTADLQILIGLILLGIAVCNRFIGANRKRPRPC